MKVSLKYTVLFIFLFANFNLFATKYTWTGSTSTAWSTSTNWSPNGVPATTDSVKIVTRTNAPVLGANTTVKELDLTSGSISLGGYSLTVSNNAYFYAGTISNGTLILRGSNAIFNGSTLNVTIDAIVARVDFSGGVFNYQSSFEQTGTSTTNGAGGCTFNAPITIKKSGAAYLTMGVSSADIFNSTLKVINTATYAVQLGYNTSASFYDSLIFENSSSSGISIGGGNANGGGHIYNGKKIAIGAGGFTAGLLTLKNFIQTGTGQQSFATTGSAITSLAGCSFEGDLTITSPGILLKTSTFNGTTEFIRSSTSSSYSEGGNVFNGTTTFRNNATNTASFRLGVQTGDQYNGNVSFITTTGYIQPAYSGTSEFKSNVSISSSLVVFNAGTGKILCTGTSNQTFSTSGSLTYLVSKFAVNKSSGTVTFYAPITIDSLLELTSGNIINSSTNLLTLKAVATVSGGSSISFVNGPLKKIGSSAFLYPVGKVNEYNPISLSSGNNITDSYVVEYFNQGQSLGSNKDTSIKEINGKMYWNCSRLSGASIPSISLYWNEKNSIFAKPSNCRISAWNSVKWKDKGQINSSGNALIGSITGNFDNTSSYYTVGRINDTTQIPVQNFLSDVGLMSLDSILTKDLLVVNGNVVYKKNIPNVYCNDTILWNSAIGDSIVNEYSNIVSSLRGKDYLGAVNVDGDTLIGGGFYKLNVIQFDDGLTLRGDSTTKYFFKSDSLIVFRKGATIKFDGVLEENVTWLLNDLRIDSLTEIHGVFFVNSFTSYKYNSGKIQLFVQGKANFNNENNFNDYVHIVNKNYLNRLRYTIPVNPQVWCAECIYNPGLELGSNPGAPGDINSALGWRNKRNINCNSINSCTADLMYALCPNTIYTCGLQTNSLGIPLNFASDIVGLNNVNLPNTRYMHMIEGESANMTIFPNSLVNKVFLLDYYYAFSNCNGPTMSSSQTWVSCISLYDGTNFTNSLGGFSYNQNLIPGSWGHALSCLNLYNLPNAIGNYNELSITGLSPQNVVQEIFLDDFSMVQLARNAGPDASVCSNSTTGVQIGVPTFCLASKPDITISYLWTSNTGYVFAPGQSTNPYIVVNPSVSTTFTLTTTIQYTDGNQVNFTCSDFDDVFVEVSNLTGSIAVNQALCTSSGATLTATPNSGTAPFSYQWDDGSIANPRIVTTNGTYTVTITDASGCSVVITQNVQNSNLAANITIVNSPCVGQSNGQISVAVQGGVPGYSYSWSNGSVSGSGNSSQSSWNITGLGTGNYTVSITDGNGCTIQSNFNMVSANGSISITNNSSNTICLGQTVQLSASGISLSGTYSWSSNGQGAFSCSSCQSTSYSPVSSQIVNVSFTTNNGCVYTNSLAIIVNQLPSAPIISSPLSNCEANHIALITNVNSSMVYNWEIINTNNGSVITQGAGTSFLVSSVWPTPFRINYTVTDPITGCSNSSSEIVYGCCVAGTYNGGLKLDMSNLTWTSIYSNPAWADFVSYNPTLSVEKLTSTVNGVRYVISINGTFTIDKDLDLQFATIEMGPLAKIIVNPGVRFLIGESNYIHSCGQYMWDGIVTTNANGVPPSYVDIYTGNSIIEDALNAVQINSPSHLYASKTTFNKNWNSLQFNGVSGNPNADILHTLLEGNRFTSMTPSTLNNDEPIYLPPHAQMLPRSAIEINNVEEFSGQKLEIGYSGFPGGPDPSELTNSYSNLVYGIRVNNSSVDIHNNAFFGIREQPSIGKAKGQGVCVVVNNDTYAGNIVVGNSNVSGIYSAIGSTAVFSKLYCNSFLSCTFGVVAINSRGSLTVVNNYDPLSGTGLSYSAPKNYFYNFDRMNSTGISTSNCKNFKLKINKNDFQNCNIAINTASTSVQIGSSYYISNNTISIPNRNLITPIPSPYYRGIVMSQWAPHSQVSANIIGNICTGQFSSCYSLIRVNNVNFINNETHVDANSSNSKIRGLWLMNSNTCNISRNVFTTVPSQVSWIPNSTGIFIDECGKNDIIENSFHKYQDHIEVFSSMTGTNFECNKFNTGLNGLIINNSFVDNQGSATSAQSNEWDVSLNTTVNIVGKNNFLQSDWYVQSSQTGSLPDPFSQSPFIGSGMEPGILIFNSPQSIICGQDPCPNCRLSEWNSILDRLNLIDTLTHKNQIYSGVFQLLNEWAGDSALNSDSLFELSFISQNKDFTAMQNLVCNLFSINLNDSINSCSSFNIESSSEFLRNLYQVTDILIRIRNEDALTSSDSSYLYDLAISNSYTEGPAVFIARGIVDEWGDDYLPDLNRAMMISPPTNQYFNVFPNPSNGFFTIESNQNAEKILIYDMVGKFIGEVQLNNNSETQIDISRLNDGVYYLKSISHLFVKRIIKISK